MPIPQLDIDLPTELTASNNGLSLELAKINKELTRENSPSKELMQINKELSLTSEIKPRR